MKQLVKVRKSKIMVDASIFKNKKLTIFETLVKHLKEDVDMTYHEIGVLLDRNERNIWTIYNRVRNK